MEQALNIYLYGLYTGLGISILTIILLIIAKPPGKSFKNFLRLFLFMAFCSLLSWIEVAIFIYSIYSVIKDWPAMKRRMSGEKDESQ